MCNHNIIGVNAKMKDDFDLKMLKKSEKNKINSRNKGNAFERKICSLLNEKFKTKDFNRTPGSGAYATNHHLPSHLKIYGDLITPKNHKFTYELKKGYNKEGVSSLFNKKSELWKFLDQCEITEQKSGRPCLLIWAQDNKNILCFCRVGLFPELPNTVKFAEYVIYEFKNILNVDESWFQFID